MSLTVVSCLTASNFSARCMSLGMMTVIRLVSVLIDLSPIGYVFTDNPQKSHEFLPIYTQGGTACRTLLPPLFTLHQMRISY